MSYHFVRRNLSRVQQRKEIAKIEKLSGKPKVGEYWYAIDNDWYEAFCTEDGDIGDIDNINIYDEVTEGLKASVGENQHFRLFSRDVYRCFDAWFNIAPELKFQVKNDANNTPTIDLYPARFLLSVETLAREEGSEEERKDDLNKVDEGKVTNKSTDILLVLSRYQRLGKLKSQISRRLQIRPQQIELFLIDPNSEEKNLIEVAKLPEEDLKKQMIDILPNLGKVIWKVKCIKSEVDESKFEEGSLFTPDNPQVGQKVDALLDKNWYEAKIVEVFPKEKIKEEVTIKEKVTKDKAKIETKEIVNDKTETTEELKEKFVFEQKVKVHFLSFPSSKDKIVKIESEEIDLAYSRVSDWREQIRQGTNVEINKNIFSTSDEWLEAEVLQIDRKGVSTLRSVYVNQITNKEVSVAKGLLDKMSKFFTKTKSKRSIREIRSDSVDSNTLEVSNSGLVLVRLTKSAISEFYSREPKKTYVVDLGSEDIAAEGTHFAKKAIVTSTLGFQFHKDVSKKPATSGAVGFRNIGNTCFMNSTLQCLMATKPLTEYFLSGEYKQDVNRKNPLGFGGKIAESYGSLVEQYFSDNYSTIAPKDFKSVFGKCYTNFAGDRQHDSQEFLTLLLDSLHEDLNKVIDKPYVEIPDANGRTDEVMSKISWENHLKRNKSIVIDHVFGQQKSHLTCPIPNCGNETTRFDPFNNLVLPIPFKDEVIVKILLVTIKPRRVKVIYDEKTEEKTHILLKADEKVEKDDEIKETRHFRFNYLVEKKKFFGTIASMFIAEKMNIKKENIFMFSLNGNTFQEKPVHQPFPSSSNISPLSVTEKKQFVAFETKDIDYPHATDIVNEKIRASYGYIDAFITSSKPKVKSISKVNKKTEEKVKTDTENQNEKVVEKVNENSSKENTKQKEDDKVFLKSKIEATKEEIDLVEVDIKASKAETEVTKSDISKKLDNDTNSSKRLKKASIESDDYGNINLLKVRFKKTAQFSKSLKHEEAIVIDEYRDTQYDIYVEVWKRVKCIFDLDRILEKPHFSATYDEISDEEITFAQSVLKVNYCKKELLPLHDILFQMQPKKYLRNMLDAEIFLSAADFLKEGLKMDPPLAFSYLRSTTVGALDKGLNVGFIYYDESMKTLVAEEEIINLYQCFDKFRKAEELEASEDWYCNKCKDHVKRATKKLDLYCTGNILVIVLKRFHSLGFTRSKLETHVDFPLENLDLSEYIIGEQTKLYDLFGVSYHMGGLGGGHYIAKAKVEDQWYGFNDSSVSKAKESEVVNKNAYVLFYKRKE